VIRAKYHELRSVKEKKTNTRRYTEETIEKMLTSEFHLSAHAIRDIITFQYEKSLEKKDAQQAAAKGPTLFDSLDI